jgi:hypothetical protein
MVPEEVAEGADGIIAEQANLPGVVVGEKGPKDVVFVPVPALEQPLRRIFEGVEDVVKMHEHADRQLRQDFKHQELHVASAFEDMAGIDEQEIA